MTIRKRILSSMKNPQDIPVLWHGLLTYSPCENQKIQEKEEEKNGGDMLSSGSDEEEEEEEDLSLQQSILDSILSSSTSFDMREFQVQDDFCIFSRTNPSSSTQDLMRKEVDRSSSLSYVYENPVSRFHRGESSFTVCVICKDAAPTGDLVESNKCNHWFCRDCIAMYLGEKIQENILKVKCPESKCKVVLKPEFCKPLVPEEVFLRWFNALAESSVLAHQTFVDCPFRDCEESFVDDERGFKIRACPKCFRLFCVFCRAAWHMGKTCLEFQVELERARRPQLRRRRRMREEWTESDYGGLKVYILE